MGTKTPPHRRKRPAPAPGRAPDRGRSRATLRRTLVVLGVVLVVGVGLVATALDRGSDGEGSTDPGAFDLPALQGDGRIRLADFEGTPVVVNFFASWCTACDAELPGYAKVARELDGQVAFVGVNAQETGDPLFMPERHGTPTGPWPGTSAAATAAASTKPSAGGGCPSAPSTTPTATSSTSTWAPSPNRYCANVSTTCTAHPPSLDGPSRGVVLGAGGGGIVG